MRFATDELQRSAEMPTWAEYVRFTDETANYPGFNTRGTVPRYVRDGLRAEIGEIYGVLARVERDNGGVWTEEYRKSLIKEVGDVLWFCARWSLHDIWSGDENETIAEIWWELGYSGFRTQGRCLHDVWAHAGNGDIGEVLESLSDFAAGYGVSLSAAAAVNMAKLRDRKARGVIQGKGDSR